MIVKMTHGRDVDGSICAMCEHRGVDGSFNYYCVHDNERIVEGIHKEYWREDKCKYFKMEEM